MTAVEGAGLKVGIELNVAGSVVVGVSVSIIIGLSERDVDGKRLPIETGVNDESIGAFDDGVSTGQ